MVTNGENLSESLLENYISELSKIDSLAKRINTKDIQY